MSKEKKTEKDLKEKKTKSSKKEKKELFAEYPNLWESRSRDDIDHTMAFAEEYMAFLDISKTEREFVKNAIEALTDKGFVDIDTKKALKSGDKVFSSIKGKGLMFAVVGKEDAFKGFNILGAHIDSPRLDLKPNPLYEEDELVFFKTHYYGGIKK
ncbi:MAG TPA: aminopeptidase, partial [Clostridiales bacterium]|nr:aminopeptidase [Clostridiales bacterium]